MLNENSPDDPRDTTTPYSMAETLRNLLFGSILTGDRRAMLDSWLSASTPGAGRIPAAVPAGWQVGHKTGSCGTAYNDIAHLRSDRGRNYILTVYFDRPNASGKEAEAVIARVTMSVLEGLD